MTRESPTTAGASLQVSFGPGNRPYDPAKQVSVAELAACRATVHWLAEHHGDRHAAVLLTQAVAVLDEAVRGCERRAGQRRLSTPATRRDRPDQRDLTAARGVIERMRAGGELLAQWEGAALLWALGHLQ